MPLLYIIRLQSRVSGRGFLKSNVLMRACKGFSVYLSFFFFFFFFQAYYCFGLWHLRVPFSAYKMSKAFTLEKSQKILFVYGIWDHIGTPTPLEGPADEACTTNNHLHVLWFCIRTLRASGDLPSAADATIGSLIIAAETLAVTLFEIFMKRRTQKGLRKLLEDF